MTSPHSFPAHTCLQAERCAMSECEVSRKHRPPEVSHRGNGRSLYATRSDEHEWQQANSRRCDDFSHLATELKHTLLAS